jgi:tetratricopeptide (TPR) repeat protein
MIAEDPQAAVNALTELASKGNDLDKEEALFRKADLYAGEARLSSKASAYNAAIAELTGYTNKYKAGFFAREAYIALSGFQRAMKKPADARATLRSMISADSSLARIGNQKLGELECNVGDWAAALAALKAAENAAGDDKTAKYTALAWQGMATLKKGDAAAARSILETVTNDENFQEDGSDDEAALAVAYPALGDSYYAAGNFQKAYDAYVLAGYYVWWNGGENEGYCLAQGYLCAKKLQGTDEKWKARADKLKTALAVGFPKDLQRVEKE